VPGVGILTKPQVLSRRARVYFQGELMKLALSIALVSLIGGALAVPAAQATRFDPHARYRFFQDRSVPSTLPGQILFGVLFKQNRHGEFTPREADGYDLQVGVSCNPGGISAFGIGGNAFSKYAYFSAVLTNGHFSHAFGSELPEGASIKGDLSGTVLKRLKRGGRVVRTARVDGTFNLEDWDPFGLTGVQENCTSSGSYSASTCKPRWMSPRSPHYDRWKRWKVPKCFGSVW
jgi:hypothetical protein